MKSPDDRLVKKLMDAIEKDSKIAPIKRWENLIKRGAINEKGEVLLKSPITEKLKSKRFQVTINIDIDNITWPGKDEDRILYAIRCILSARCQGMTQDYYQYEFMGPMRMYNPTVVKVENEDA